MPRYVKTEVYFTNKDNTKTKWAPAVLDLDCVATCNPSIIFDDYDTNADNCPEPNCTEVLLKDGTDFTANIPFDKFSELLISEKPRW